MVEPLLKVENVTKKFPGVIALDQIELTVGRGEVHGLMGENGAGKSTLIKVLSGIYKKDAGDIWFDGEKIEPTSMQEANEIGISTIFQELDLIPEQAVYENLYVGRELKNNFGVVDHGQMIAEAEKSLNQLGVKIDVTQPLKKYSTATQQMISIARATATEAKLVIMDEPTSSLDSSEVEVLFDVIAHLKEQGISIIFISHKLDEVYEICDRLTVLRNGQFITDADIDQLNQFELVSHMIGEEYVGQDKVKKERPQTGEEIVQLENIHEGYALNGIDLTIRKGEIVGLAGLLGSGRTETAKILFGVNQPTSGSVYWYGDETKMKNPSDTISRGIGFLTEDRKTEGIFPNLSVKDNMTITSIDQISNKGFIDFEKENEIVDQYIDILKIKTPSKGQLIKNLSGGNQQKVLLARWMMINPQLIIMDDPTRGIDVGSKREIEGIIQDIAEQGVSILMISSEIEELIRNCDRIVVLRDGKTIVELTGAEMNQEDIMKSIARHTPEEEEINHVD